MARSFNHPSILPAFRTAFSAGPRLTRCELIAARLPGTQKPHMLDVGCGVGEIHPFLQGIFGRVCGADVSGSSVAQARIRNPEVEYQAYMGETLPYESATFDVSMAICVLHHVLPSQWARFLREDAAGGPPGRPRLPDRA
jgi:ubiquinone/menaquinone biosynthesis C-methylase UbiE